jgi:hypothetical protein
LAVERHLLSGWSLVVAALLGAPAEIYGEMLLVSVVLRGTRAATASVDGSILRRDDEIASAPIKRGDFLCDDSLGGLVKFKAEFTGLVLRLAFAKLFENFCLNVSVPNASRDGFVEVWAPLLRPGAGLQVRECVA